MNCILLEPSDLIAAPPSGVIRGGRCVLRGRRARHIVEVLRAEAGQTVRAGLLGGRLGHAVVSSLAAESVTLEAIDLDADPPAPFPVTLCVALPRPKSLRRVLLAASSLGVKHIVLMESWRVDKSYWQSPQLTPEAVRSVLVLGLEQAVDTILPAVEVRRRFRPFVEDEVPALIRGTSAIVAHPASSETMPRGWSGPITLFVGPDRGFTSFEIELLGRQGVTPRRFGPRILRVDDAVPVLLGRLLPE